MDKQEISNNKTKELSEMEYYFEKEEKALDETINEINDLYDEVKDHYNLVKNASKSANGGRGVLSFLEKQTANLVTLKNSKVNLIQSKINLKKISAELAMKQRKDTDESQISNDIVNAILNKLDEQNEDSIIIDEDEFMEDNISEEDLLESRIQSLIDNGDIKDTSETKDFEDGILAIKIKDKKWKFVGIDEKGRVIKNFPVPDKKDYKIKVKRNSEGKYAVDQNGKVYKVIEIR